ncbi:hypothetical protein [Streptomyces rubradiris]|uniref:Uncharacterized protein n=1 Tax=Streptomyces rubradiris TaxID=285531 RepID=A0ABQ3RAG6_STRRR|nr:hypothetical protein [Streptomyces rubradiris]GHH31449.1 hypothetical protein GCM10018792_79210 [Streptomyces rubradiris]GHI52839.1 hypothetical protein Srubr_26850 [Streptomyces rubradiris]
MDIEVELEWVPTQDVQVGDRIACLLSDAHAYPRVTGWTDRVLELSRHGLKDVTHRKFQVSEAPWWAEDMTTFNLARQALIVSREANQEPVRGGGVDGPSVEEMQEWLSEGGAEARDGCWVEPDGKCEHGSPSWLLLLGTI